eukprot:2656157-Rhodomonas_salina.2
MRVRVCSRACTRGGDGDGHRVREHASPGLVVGSEEIHHLAPAHTTSAKENTPCPPPHLAPPSPT